MRTRKGEVVPEPRCLEELQTTEVFYRGQSGALFKRDYGRIYQELFPDLRLLKEGFLSQAEGWDEANYWVFENPRAYLT